MWPSRSTSETSPETRVYHVFRDFAGFKVTCLIRLTTVAQCGTLLARRLPHHWNHQSTYLTHKQTRCRRIEWTYSQTVRLLTAKICQCPGSRLHPQRTTTWSKGLVNGGLDICGRRLTIWCTPSCVMPFYYSKVLGSQILLYSRASDGILTGQRVKCHGCNHRRTVSLSSGAHGRSYTRTTGAYKLDVIALHNVPFCCHHSHALLSPIPSFIHSFIHQAFHLHLLPSQPSSLSHHCG